jgi:hypothetical protein
VAHVLTVGLGATAELTGNEIVGGSAGAVYAEAYAVQLQGAATLADNFVRGGTGGSGQTFGYAVAADAPVTMVNNVVEIGSANSYNIGVLPWAGGLLVHNTIIPGDEPDGFPGVYLGGDAILVNNILNWIFMIGGGTLLLQHNDVWDDEAGCLLHNHDSLETIYTVEELNACAWQGCVAAAGNLSDDPALADPANGDYHLTLGSPCIDFGVDPATWYSGDLAAFDFEGDARPSGAGWDIGADEYAP